MPSQNILAAATKVLLKASNLLASVLGEGYISLYMGSQEAESTPRGPAAYDFIPVLFSLIWKCLLTETILHSCAFLPGELGKQCNLSLFVRRVSVSKMKTILFHTFQSRKKGDFLLVSLEINSLQRL